MGDVGSAKKKEFGVGTAGKRDERRESERHGIQILCSLWLHSSLVPCSRIMSSPPTFLPISPCHPCSQACSKRRESDEGDRLRVPKLHRLRHLRQCSQA